MQVHEGDLVEVDRLGLPHHGHWGVVHKVEAVEAVVLLVQLTKEGTYAARALERFETWELRVLLRAHDRRSGE
jgi:hypothetical protein